MSNGPELRSCVESPDLLIQFCLEVVDRVDKRQRNEQTVEWENQFRQILLAINNLKKAEIVVPDELLQLKTDLEAKLSVPDEIVDRLKLLANGFENLLRDIRSRIRRSNRPGSRKFSTELATPGKVLREEILRALQHLGGASPAKKVLDEIGERLAEKLSPRDLDKFPDGQLIWSKHARRERGRMVKEGILRSDSEVGIWELNSEYK